MSTSKSNAEPDGARDSDEQDDAVIGRAFVNSVYVISVICVLGLAAFFIFRRKEAKETENVAAPKALSKRNTDPLVIPKISFTDITKQSGINFVHQNGAYGAKLLPETMGGGGAFFDYDSDGDQDLLLVNSNYWPWDDRKNAQPATTALFQNDGTGKFTDVSGAVGLAISFYGMGPAIGDFDNDGDVDIFLTAVGKNRLFRNEGGEQFVEVTDDAGVGGEANRWSTSATFFDYDNDGLLDLFVCNYVEWSRKYDESQAFTLEGVGRAYGPPKSFGGTLPYLYHNEGNGKFKDVSAEMGIQILNRVTKVPVAKSMGVASIDLDQDGYLDLIVANDTVRNFIFHNQGGKKMKEIGQLSGVAFDSGGKARGAMGIDTGYYRNNQTVGVCIGNFANEMSALYIAQRDPLQFVDAAIASGFGPPTRSALTFGTFFFDYDLDGRLDILGANGHLEEDINKVIPSQHHAQPPQLYWNAGEGKQSEFVQVPSQHVGADFVKPMVGRGAAFADIDNDGDQDVILIACGGQPRLLRNDQETNHRWIRVALTGKKCNRSAIGAWIEVHVGKQVIRRQVMATRSYLSQCELPTTIGLGKAEKPDKVVVRWPDGETEEISCEIGKLTRFTQGDSKVASTKSK